MTENIDSNTPAAEGSTESHHEGEYDTSPVTMSIAQEQLLLDNSAMGAVKLQDSVIVYANSQAAKFCQSQLVDALVHKTKEEVFSETACQCIEVWSEKDPEPLAVEQMETEQLVNSEERMNAWIMHSIFQEQPCVQILFSLKKSLKENTVKKESIKKKVEDSSGARVRQVTEMLQQNNFFILFQPVACLTGGNEAHYDVMLRMRTDEGAEISAGEFMGEIDMHPIAAKLDRWVMLQAIKSLLQHRQREKQAHLFIHLSGASVIDQTLPPWLFQLIQKSGVAPDTMIFQIAESTAVRFKKESHRLFRSAQNMGCRTNLCHFGLVDEPMDMLGEISCNYVKLHNAFTRRLVDNRSSEQDVRTLIGELHDLGLKTIVPHVETPNVMTQLWRCGVDYVQGYFLQRPQREMNYDFSSDS